MAFVLLMAESLSGTVSIVMIFINTRPSGRAISLTQALRKRRLPVLELPLLELKALSINALEQQYHNSFIQTERYHALVVVSPSAARLGLALCPRGFKPNCVVVAVGHATAAVLQNAGWTVQCPEEASNEGMLKMGSLSTLAKENHILIWRGHGGRRLLVTHLQDKGVIVDAIVLYQRQPPNDLAANFRDIKLQLMKAPQLNLLNKLSKPVVLISSSDAFTNWQQLLNEISHEPPNYQLSDFKYLALGKRLTHILASQHLENACINSLCADEVWRGMQLLSICPQQISKGI